jgi:hypothetical protein
MGSCHVPDRSRRSGVEKDSFATLMGYWRTAHRMASRCGEPGALLLIRFIGQSRFRLNRMPRQPLDIAVGLSFERVEIGDDVLPVDAAGKVHEHFCLMHDASGARQKPVERGSAGPVSSATRTIPSAILPSICFVAPPVGSRRRAQSATPAPQVPAKCDT